MLLVKAVLSKPSTAQVYISGALKTSVDDYTLLIAATLVLVQWARLVRTLKQPEGMKCGMCMSIARLNSGYHLVTGYEDGTLAMWSMAVTSGPLMKCKPHGEPIMALGVHNQGESWASAFQIWDSSFNFCHAVYKLFLLDFQAPWWSYLWPFWSKTNVSQITDRFIARTSHAKLLHSFIRVVHYLSALKSL